VSRFGVASLFGGRERSLGRFLRSFASIGRAIIEKLRYPRIQNAKRFAEMQILR